MRQSPTQGEGTSSEAIAIAIHRARLRNAVPSVMSVSFIAFARRTRFEKWGVTHEGMTGIHTSRTSGPAGSGNTCGRPLKMRVNRATRRPT